MPEVGMIGAGVGMLVAVTIGLAIFFNISDSLLEQQIPIEPNDSSWTTIYNSNSREQGFGEASGVITTFSSVGDSYLVNFKDDLSDYKFTGVDSTELYFLQYAFEHNESVTVSYTTDDDVKILEGVTLSSPAPVIDPNKTVEPNSGFDWNLVVIVVTGMVGSIGLLLIAYRADRRQMERLRNIDEQFTRTPSFFNEEEQPTQETIKQPKKKEQKKEAVLPLDGRYRVERAEKLLNEKDKKEK